MPSGAGSDFVVAAANVLNERMTADDRGGGSVAFETAHRPKSCVESTMITFDPTVCDSGRRPLPIVAPVRMAGRLDTF